VVGVEQEPVEAVAPFDRRKRDQHVVDADIAVQHVPDEQQ
jgi:hypothetical protein